MLRRGKLFDHFFGQGERLQAAGMMGVVAGPDAGFEAFDRERVSLEELVAEDEARAAEFGGGRDGAKLVAKARGGEEFYFYIDDGNAHDFVGCKEGGQRQAGQRKERGHAAVEPDHVIGIEDNVRGIAVAPFHADSPLAYQHLRDPHEYVPRTNFLTIGVRSNTALSRFGHGAFVAVKTLQK